MQSIKYGPLWSHTFHIYHFVSTLHEDVEY